MVFSDITTRNELADFLGIKRKNLTYILFKETVEHYYETFEIPKKNGGFRHICAPTGKLKRIQRKLLNRLTEYIELVRVQNNIKINISHAFEKNRNIMTNADIHKNKKVVISFDLQDYFESFHIGRVIGFFEKNKYFNFSHEVAVTIAQIACFHNHLPQGAPTSPIITNLISQILDYKLLSLSKKYHFDFTRYADDLTFSTNEKRYFEQSNIDSFLNKVTSVVIKSGFTLNDKKTRVVFNNSRQLVTGLVVNEKINVPRDYYKNTRAMFYSFYTSGKYLDNDEIKNDSSTLEGRFSFIDCIEHYNNSRDKNFSDKNVKHDVFNLTSKEKEYRNFLFYNYFINNDKPLLFTEGKTDILYIKAALKNLYKFYPKLVSLENRKFVFKVRFFHRTEKMNYYLGISKDGADTMTKFYDFFYRNHKKGLANFFLAKKAIASSQPVFLIFDNETKKFKDSNGKLKERPLSNILSKLDESQKKEVKNNNICLLDEYSNLNLVSIPLTPGKSECEIEDLFPKDVLNKVIDGKKFSRKEDNNERYYNKDTFSKYVIQHYESINFDSFKPLLDIINSKCS